MKFRKVDCTSDGSPYFWLHTGFLKLTFCERRADSALLDILCGLHCASRTVMTSLQIAHSGKRPAKGRKKTTNHQYPGRTGIIKSSPRYRWVIRHPDQMRSGSESISDGDISWKGYPMKVPSHSQKPLVAVLPRCTTSAHGFLCAHGRDDNKKKTRAIAVKQITWKICLVFKNVCGGMWCKSLLYTSSAGGTELRKVYGRREGGPLGSVFLNLAFKNVSAIPIL